MSAALAVIVGVAAVQLLACIVWCACNFPVWIRGHETLLPPLEGER